MLQFLNIVLLNMYLLLLILDFNLDMLLIFVKINFHWYLFWFFFGGDALFNSKHQNDSNERGKEHAYY